jgi:hypothetical protein
VGLYLHSPVRLHDIVFNEAHGDLSLLAFMITCCLFQTRNDTIRAFNEISDLVSKLIIPVKQVK